MCPELECVVSEWQSVIVVLLKVGSGARRLSVHTKQNINRGYASVIIPYPRTVDPLNRTRLDKAHVHRRVYKLVMYVYAKYARKKIERYRFFNW